MVPPTLSLPICLVTFAECTASRLLFWRRPQSGAEIPRCKRGHRRRGRGKWLSTIGACRLPVSMALPSLMLLPVIRAGRRSRPRRLHVGKAVSLIRSSTPSWDIRWSCSTGSIEQNGQSCLKLN
ncbi:hypothetical protein H4582DRAFT_1010461 [Lactarius indigo]|nr:hypothetical protein H4582DRAFT_1010461 [Lactarius indigo]